MKQLGHIIDRVVGIFGHFSGLLVLLMMVLIFAEVFMRYALNSPLMLADEFGAYLYVALCFLGAAYTWKKKGHVRILFLVYRLPPRVANWLRLVTLALAFTFMVLLTQASYGFVARSFKLGLKSATWFHTPIQGPHLMIAIGFALLSLLLIVEVVRAIINIRTGVDAEERDQ